MKDKEKLKVVPKKKNTTGTNKKGTLTEDTNNGTVAKDTLDLYSFNEVDHEAEKIREEKRRHHANNEKKRKDKISAGIVHLQTLLPVDSSRPNQKESLVAILARSASYIQEMQAKVTLCMEGMTESVKEDTIMELRLKVETLSKQNQQYMDILRSANVPEEYINNPDQIIETNARTGNLLPGNFTKKMLQNACDAMDKRSQSSKSRNTISEHYKRIEAKKAEDLEDVMDIAFSDTPASNIASEPLLVCSQPNLLVAPVSQSNGIFISPKTAAPSGVDPRTTMELSGVSGLLSLAKGSDVLASSDSMCLSSPSDIARDACVATTVSSETVSEHVPITSVNAAAIGGTTSVTPSPNLATPIMTPTSVIGASAPSVLAPRPPLLAATSSINQGLAPPILNTPLQGKLMMQNGQLILIKDNMPLPNLTSGVGNSATTSSQGLTSLSSSLITPGAPQIIGQQQNGIFPGGQSGLTITNQPSQPGTLPQALMLPNGQIVPVVTQPNILFPSNQGKPAPIIGQPALGQAPVLAPAPSNGVILPASGTSAASKPAEQTNNLTNLTSSTATSVSAVKSGASVLGLNNNGIVTNATLPSNVTLSTASDGTLVLTLPPGVNPSSMVLDPMLMSRIAAHNAAVKAGNKAGGAGVLGAGKKASGGQRVLMPKPSSISIRPPVPISLESMLTTATTVTTATSDSGTTPLSVNVTDTSTSQSAGSGPTDILAKAAESIFSPGMLADDQPLQIDAPEATSEAQSAEGCEEDSSKNMQKKKKAKPKKKKAAPSSDLNDQVAAVSTSASTPGAVTFTQLPGGAPVPFPLVGLPQVAMPTVSAASAAQPTVSSSSSITSTPQSTNLSMLPGATSTLTASSTNAPPVMTPNMLVAPQTALINTAMGLQQVVLNGSLAGQVLVQGPNGTLMLQNLPSQLNSGTSLNSAPISSVSTASTTDTGVSSASVANVSESSLPETSTPAAVDATSLSSSTTTPLSTSLVTETSPSKLNPSLPAIFPTQVTPASLLNSTSADAVTTSSATGDVPRTTESQEAPACSIAATPGNAATPLSSSDAKSSDETQKSKKKKSKKSKKKSKHDSESESSEKKQKRSKEEKEKAKVEKEKAKAEKSDKKKRKEEKKKKKEEKHKKSLRPEDIIPEKLTFSENDLNDVLDQVENFGATLAMTPTKSRKHRRKSERGNSGDEPHSKKRKRNNSEKEAKKVEDESKVCLAMNERALQESGNRNKMQQEQQTFSIFEKAMESIGDLGGPGENEATAAADEEEPPMNTLRSASPKIIRLGEHSRRESQILHLNSMDSSSSPEMDDGMVIADDSDVEHSADEDKLDIKKSQTSVTDIDKIFNSSKDRVSKNLTSTGRQEANVAGQSIFDAVPSIISSASDQQEKLSKSVASEEDTIMRSLSFLSDMSSNLGKKQDDRSNDSSDWSKPEVPTSANAEKKSGTTGPAMHSNLALIARGVTPSKSGVVPISSKLSAMHSHTTGGASNMSKVPSYAEGLDNNNKLDSLKSSSKESTSSPPSLYSSEFYGLELDSKTTSLDSRDKCSSGRSYNTSVPTYQSNSGYDISLQDKRSDGTESGKTDYYDPIPDANRKSFIDIPLTTSSSKRADGLKTPAEKKSFGDVARKSTNEASDASRQSNFDNFKGKGSHDQPGMSANPSGYGVKSGRPSSKEVIPSPHGSSRPTTPSVQIDSALADSGLSPAGSLSSGAGLFSPPSVGSTSSRVSQPASSNVSTGSRSQNEARSASVDSGLGGSLTSPQAKHIQMSASSQPQLNASGYPRSGSMPHNNQQHNNQHHNNQQHNNQPLNNSNNNQPGNQRQANQQPTNSSNIHRSGSKTKNADLLAPPRVTQSPNHLGTRTSPNKTSPQSSCRRNSGSTSTKNSGPYTMTSLGIPPPFLGYPPPGGGMDSSCMRSSVAPVTLPASTSGTSTFSFTLSSTSNTSTTTSASCANPYAAPNMASSQYPAFYPPTLNSAMGTTAAGSAASKQISPRGGHGYDSNISGRNDPGGMTVPERGAMSANRMPSSSPYLQQQPGISTSSTQNSYENRLSGLSGREKDGSLRSSGSHSSLAPSAVLGGTSPQRSVGRSPHHMSTPHDPSMPYYPPGNHIPAAPSGASSGYPGRTDHVQQNSGRPYQNERSSSSMPASESGIPRLHHPPSGPESNSRSNSQTQGGASAGSGSDSMHSLQSSNRPFNTPSGMGQFPPYNQTAPYDGQQSGFPGRHGNAPPPHSSSSAGNYGSAHKSSSTGSSSNRQKNLSSKPNHQQHPSPGNASSGGGSKSKSKSSGGVAKKHSASMRSGYEVDTNLGNSIFDQGRSMTPLFPPPLSPSSRNMQAEGPMYMPSHLFGTNAGRPLSNTNPLAQLHNKAELGFNQLLRPQNGIFQAGFGMNPAAGHMAPHSSAGPLSHHPHMPNFTLSNLFPEVPGGPSPAPQADPTLNMSPIKFSGLSHPGIHPGSQGAHDGSSLQHPPHAHQSNSMYHHPRGPPILHNAMSINSILGHGSHGFEGRPMAGAAGMGPAGFHPGHGQPFGFSPLNFQLHDP